MNNTKAMATLLMVAFALTACGGGGSSSPNTSSSNSPGTGGGSNSSGSDGSIAGRLDGSYASFNSSGGGAEIGRLVESFDNKNKDVLVVDGKRIQLVYPGISAGKFVIANDVVVGMNLSYARYGAYLGGKDIYLYAQGTGTPDKNMPISGTAKYAGIAYVKGVNYQESGVKYNTADATANFTVDFGKKAISGAIANIVDINKKPANNIELSGVINGHQFYGRSLSGTHMEGDFFGPNADEIAGTFVNMGAGFGGAFGAKKQ
ncbi:transferrin-binding protein-like solute binding protein [Stenoxybacter acetivorans]|uniref:transferrin-binding protein-like solute binding protein n=1 Tax=Stenoxybacter acetivorans TaxID=422441 RepID=UPI00055E96BE|nr:transferrin-binding protein-like solute binding protein [Stenoxybacter acetivorans]